MGGLNLVDPEFIKSQLEKYLSDHPLHTGPLHLDARIVFTDCITFDCIIKVEKIAFV